MKHLVISEYGTFLGLKSSQLVVKNDQSYKRYPLNRLHTVSISKNGVNISSNLIRSMADRGIKLFFLDYRGVAQAALVANAQHAVVSVRNAQMQYCSQEKKDLPSKIVYGKIKNQYAVLNYLNKYHKNPFLDQGIEELKVFYNQIANFTASQRLLGIEGSSARAYFKSLSRGHLFPSSFKKREGRGSLEITNSMLNMGYAVLSSRIYGAIVNAGLEPYLGFFHVQRPGRPSLVLDLMEEYRAWVVDRAVIKLRKKIYKETKMTPEIKKELITEVQNTLNKKYHYIGKKMPLEYIMQRQIYRLSGHFKKQMVYKPYIFKW